MAGPETKSDSHAASSAGAWRLTGDQLRWLCVLYGRSAYFGIFSPVTYQQHLPTTHQIEAQTDDFYLMQIS